MRVGISIDPPLAAIPPLLREEGVDVYQTVLRDPGRFGNYGVPEPADRAAAAADAPAEAPKARLRNVRRADRCIPWFSCPSDEQAAGWRDIDSVADLADYAYVLKPGGEIALRGTPAEVFAHADEIARSNIRPPLLAELFARLRAGAADAPEPELTVSDAAAALLRWRER